MKPDHNPFTWPAIASTSLLAGAVALWLLAPKDSQEIKKKVSHEISAIIDYYNSWWTLVCYEPYKDISKTDNRTHINPEELNIWVSKIIWDRIYIDRWWDWWDYDYDLRNCKVG